MVTLAKLGSATATPDVHGDEAHSPVYALLAGRNGGQTLRGSPTAGENLTLTASPFPGGTLTLESGAGGGARIVIGTNIRLETEVRAGRFVDIDTGVYSINLATGSLEGNVVGPGRRTVARWDDHPLIGFTVEVGRFRVAGGLTSWLTGDVRIGDDATPTAKLDIKQTVDQEALRVTGHTTQTTDLFQLRDSALVNVFRVSNAGNTSIAGTLGVTGAASISGLLTASAHIKMGTAGQIQDANAAARITVETASPHVKVDGDMTITVVTTGSVVVGSTQTARDKIALKPSAVNLGTSFTGTLTPGNLTADRTYTLPDAAGTVATAGATISWSAGHTWLTGASITMNLGSSATFNIAPVFAAGLDAKYMKITDDPGFVKNSIDNDVISIRSASPAVIIAELNCGTSLQVAGAPYTPVASFDINSEFFPAVNALGRVARISGTLYEAASGTHARMMGLELTAPVISNAGAATTDAITLYVSGPPTGITPTAGLYSVWVDAGLNRFDGDGTHVFELPQDDTSIGAGPSTGRIPIKVGGATRYIAYYT